MSRQTFQFQTNIEEDETVLKMSDINCNLNLAYCIVTFSTYLKIQTVFSSNGSSFLGLKHGQVIFDYNMNNVKARCESGLFKNNIQGQIKRLTHPEPLLVHRTWWHSLRHPGWSRQLARVKAGQELNKTETFLSKPTSEVCFNIAFCLPLQCQLRASSFHFFFYAAC